MTAQLHNLPPPLREQLRLNCHPVLVENTPKPTIGILSAMASVAVFCPLNRPWWAGIDLLVLKQSKWRMYLK